MPCKPYRVVLLLAAALIGFTARAQTTSPSPPESGPKQSIVRGRVIYEDTRRPLRRAHVSIYDPAAKNRLQHLFTWTDGRGEFQIRKVPAGKYFVDVNAPGIVRPGTTYTDNEDEPFTSVSVDGASTADVVVRVRRGAAISGRITYADGDPAVQVAIKVLRKKDGKWTPVYVSSGSSDRVATDDRGVYRVSGLIPGEYIVGAAEEKWGIEVGAVDRPDGSTYLNRAALPPTFYNGATSLAAATPIALQAGAEQKDIDIVLSDRPLHSISGTVTLKSSLRTVTRARISLKRKDENSGPEQSDLEDMVTNTDEDGRFNLDEVPDGVYRMTVAPPRSYVRGGENGPTAQELGQRYVAKSLEVNLSGADIKDLAIEVSAGSRISGTISVEGGKPLPPQLMVYVTTKGAPGEGPAPVRPDAEGSFSVEGVQAGPAYVRNSVPFDKNYYTKSVSVGKTDLLRGPLMVKENEDVTDVRVVISPDVAMFSGRVLGLDGKTPEGGINVVLLPADAEEQKSGYRVFGNTNPGGGFRLTAAPGEYFAIAMPRNEPAYQSSGEALRMRYPNASRVVLQAGENPKADLMLAKP